MSTKINVLKILSDNNGSYVSGQKIADELQISRAAINKAINTLKGEGYRIFSRTKVGYMLSDESEVLSESAIASSLRNPCNVIYLPSVGSTNDFAKSIDVRDVKMPTAVVADSQNAGKGRLGRSFYSPSGSGIYLSLLLRPTFELDKALLITISAAVSVCHAIEEVCNKSPRIKWVNDLFLENKKICGILTEAQTNFENGQIDKIVIGVGINCFQSGFPADLVSVAGSISNVAGEFSRAKLAASVIDNLIENISSISHKNLLNEYRRRSFLPGKNIFVLDIASKQKIRAKAIDIDDNGGLIIEWMEGPKMREMETLTSGEVSIRLDEGV